MPGVAHCQPAMLDVCRHSGRWQKGASPAGCGEIKPWLRSAEGGVQKFSWQNSGCSAMGLQPELASCAEACHSKLPREPVCMAVTGLYSAGCPKQLWMVLFPALPFPEDTSCYSHGTLASRCQKAQQPKKQTEQDAKELEAGFACAAWEGTGKPSQVIISIGCESL